VGGKREPEHGAWPSLFLERVRGLMAAHGRPGGFDRNKTGQVSCTAPCPLSSASRQRKVRCGRQASAANPVRIVRRVTLSSSVSRFFQNVALGPRPPSAGRVRVFGVPRRRDGGRSSGVRRRAVRSRPPLLLLFQQCRRPGQNVRSRHVQVVFAAGEHNYTNAVRLG